MAEEKRSNNVRRLREAQLMSKAELARKAGLSPLTIDRVEKGKPCRMDTKRKIILALGLKLTDRTKVFPDDAPGPTATKRRRTHKPTDGGDNSATADSDEGGSEPSKPSENLPKARIS